MDRTHVDDRDAYMAGRLRWLARNEHDVLAIVGAGHVDGIARRLDGRADLPATLVQLPTFVEPSEVPADPGPADD